MPKYRVNLDGYASATIEIETEETDPEVIAKEALREGVPGICAQCSGWGHSHSLEIGEEWELATDEEGGISVYEVES